MVEFRTGIYMFACLIPLFLSTYRILLLKDFSSFWDAKQYLAGFQAIQLTGEISAARPYFGKFTEIILSLIYLFLSLFFSVDSIQEILIVNNSIFWVIYIPAIRIFLGKIFLNLETRVNHDRFVNMLWLIILYTTPIGIAMQVGRQAICFSLIILIVGIFSNFKFKILPISLYLVTLITHIYSIVTAFIVLKIYQAKFILAIIPLIITIIMIYLALPLYNKYVPELYSQTTISEFSNPYLNYTFIIILLFFLPTQRTDWKIKKVTFSCIIIGMVFLYAYQPLFLAQRLLFGMDHVLLIIICSTLLVRRYKKISNHLILKSYVILPVSFMIKIIESVVLL